MVLDASAILAALREELGGDVVYDHVHDASVSTVNVCEVYTYAALHSLPKEVVDRFFDYEGMNVVSLDKKTAAAAGAMAAITKSAGLSLGDRCCLALAQSRDAEVLTADRNWADFADPLGLRITLIR